MAIVEQSTKIAAKKVPKMLGGGVSKLSMAGYAVAPLFSLWGLHTAWTSHEMTSMKILDVAGTAITEPLTYIPFVGMPIALGVQLPFSIGVSILESIAQNAGSQNQFKTSPMVYNNKVAQSISRATSKMGALAGTSMSSQNRAYGLHRKYGLSL